MHYVNDPNPNDHTRCVKSKYDDRKSLGSACDAGIHAPEVVEGVKAQPEDLHHLRSGDTATAAAAFSDYRAP